MNAGPECILKRGGRAKSMADNLCLLLAGNLIWAAGLQGAWGAVAGWAANSANMNPQHCDLVVFDVSQEDVAGTPAVQMRNVTSVIHTGEPSDGNVENQVEQMLDLSGFPADPPAGTPGAGVFFNSSL